MINFNGSIIAKNKINLALNNRAFSYGDALFETIKITNKSVQFLEDHYFRLMASMRMLRMEIPMYFTIEFFEEEILKTAEIIPNLDLIRVRFSVFRKVGGLFTPKTNEIDFLVEGSQINYNNKADYEIDIYKGYSVNSGLLSTLKTNNRIINVLASIYANENGLDNCLLINEKKNIVEANNGNLFLIKGNEIKTPALTEGCIKGVVRKKIIDMIQKNGEYLLRISEISPFELQKADALFITNAVMEIQTVTKYRKKMYNQLIVKNLIKNFKEYKLIN